MKRQFCCSSSFLPHPPTSPDAERAPTRGPPPLLHNKSLHAHPRNHLFSSKLLPKALPPHPSRYRSTTPHRTEVALRSTQVATDPPHRTAPKSIQIHHTAPHPRRSKIHHQRESIATAPESLPDPSPKGERYHHTVVALDPSLAGERRHRSEVAAKSSPEGERHLQKESVDCRSTLQKHQEDVVTNLLQQQHLLTPKRGIINRHQRRYYTHLLPK